MGGDGSEVDGLSFQPKSYFRTFYLACSYFPVSSSIHIDLLSFAMFFDTHRRQHRKENLLQTDNPTSIRLSICGSLPLNRLLRVLAG